MANVYTTAETVGSQAELFIVWNMTGGFGFCRAADRTYSMADFPSAEAVSHHPHMSYTERLEEAIMKSYRQCQKEARTNVLRVNSNHQCSACHHSMFIYA